LNGWAFKKILSVSIMLRLFSHIIHSSFAVCKSSVSYDQRISAAGNQEGGSDITENREVKGTIDKLSMNVVIRLFL
jgi:hypothetical protein